MVAVGTWIWLASDLMFFAALFAAYFNLRTITNAAAAQAGVESLWQWGSAHFNMPFAVKIGRASCRERVSSPV